MCIVVLDDSTLCKVAIFAFYFNPNKASVRSKLESKFSSDFTSILSRRAFDFSPFSVVWVCGIEEFVDLHVPVVRAAKSGFNGANLCPEIVIAPVAFVTNTPYAKSVATVAIVHHFCPKGFSERYCAEEILTGKVSKIRLRDK
jgi:hypothetical protein